MLANVCMGEYCETKNLQQRPKARYPFCCIIYLYPLFLFSFKRLGRNLLPDRPGALLAMLQNKKARPFFLPPCFTLIFSPSYASFLERLIAFFNSGTKIAAEIIFTASPGKNGTTQALNAATNPLPVSKTNQTVPNR